MVSVRLVPTGPVRCGSRAWRAQGKPFTTVVVKAAFAFDGAGAVHVTEPDEICERDEHYDKDTFKSLRDCSDLAPYLGSAEVLFKGSGYPVQGDGVRARVVVVQGGAPLVDKAFFVRRPSGARTSSDGSVFSSARDRGIPITCENALGGPSISENPVGRHDPLVVHDTDPSRPALLGPIARLWRARAGLLKPAEKKALQQRECLIKEGFAWEYFQTAPPDQRVQTFFTGSETVILEHLQPERARVEVQLPGARAVALWMRPGSPAIPITLRADLLRIDGDRRRVTLVWRGFFETSDDAGRMVIAAGLALPGQPIEWPNVTPQDEETVDDTETQDFAVTALDTTGVIHLDGLNAGLPFAAAVVASSGDGDRATSEPIPGAPWAQPDAPIAAPPRSAAGIEETLPLGSILVPPDIDFSHGQPCESENDASPSLAAPPVAFAAWAPPPPTPASSSAPDEPVTLAPGLGSLLLIALSANPPPQP